MSTIQVSDLHPAGSDLFSDSESFMHELGDNDLGNITGGFIWTTTITTTTIFIPGNCGQEPEQVCNPDTGPCGYHDEESLTCHS